MTENNPKKIRQQLLSKLTRPACSSQTLSPLVSACLACPAKNAALFALLSESDSSQCPPGCSLPSLSKNKLRCLSVLVKCIMTADHSYLRHLSDYLLVLENQIGSQTDFTGYPLAVCVAKHLSFITNDCLPRLPERYQTFVANFVVALLTLCFDSMDRHPAVCSNLILKTVTACNSQVLDLHLGFLMDALVSQVSKEGLQNQMLLETLLVLLLNPSLSREKRSNQRILDTVMLFNSLQEGSRLEIQSVKLLLDILYSTCIQDRQLVAINSQSIQAFADKVVALYQHQVISQAVDSLLQMLQKHSHTNESHLVSKRTYTTQATQPAVTQGSHVSVDESIMTSLQNIILQQKQIITDQHAKTEGMQQQMVLLAGKVENLESLYIQKDQQIAMLYDNVGSLMEKLHEREIRKDCQEVRYEIQEQEAFDNGKSTPNLRSMKIPLQLDDQNDTQSVGLQKIQQQFKEHQEEADESSEQEQRVFRAESISQEGDSVQMMQPPGGESEQNEDIVIDLQDDKVFLQIIQQTDRIDYYLSRIDDQSLSLLVHKITEYLYSHLASFLKTDCLTFTDILTWLDAFLSDDYYAQLISIPMAKDLKVLLTRIVVGRENEMELGKQTMVYSLINKLIHKLTGYLQEE